MVNFTSNVTSVTSSNFNAYSLKKASASSAAAPSSNQPSKSNIPPLRGRFINMIEQHAKTESGAKQLLTTFSQSSTGGFITAGLPDISSPDVMARHDRISKKFSIEQQGFERQKTNLINDGLANGKSSKVILKEIVNLYDAQPELFKIGVGWNGQVFDFNESSTDGYQSVLEYSRDVVDIQA
jgi:hypothetical protein